MVRDFGRFVRVICHGGQFVIISKVICYYIYCKVTWFLASSSASTGVIFSTFSQKPSDCLGLVYGLGLGMGYRWVRGIVGCGIWLSLGVRVRYSIR